MTADNNRNWVIHYTYVFDKQSLVQCEVEGVKCNH